MAWRTNKMWILKKKQQLEKLRILKKWWKSYLKNKNLSDEEKLAKWLIFEQTNPKWKNYKRDKSWRKVICIETGLREDFDWYRLLFKPNSSELEYKFSGFNAQLNKKIKLRKVKHRNIDNFC